ncbi:polysaccharide biosynthesis protein [Candidatus Vecturithrix granuli]|uniref:Polysaccharide biosynthesis protein n=1 Tax=Vecturithrix granuli TaxID=1499967 RepID=A0A081BXV0_VECG1|nr:polysaccharide biosynthesis protein [Candidatus Vecturithrix granuli]
MQQVVVKNVVIQGGVFTFNFLTSLAIPVLLAHLLGRDGVGRYGYYYRLFDWLAAIALFIMPPILIRYVAELRGQYRISKTWNLLKKSFWLQGMITLLVVFGSTLYFFGILERSRTDRVLFMIIQLAFGCYSFGRIGESFIKGYQAYGRVAIAGIISTIARFMGLSILFSMKEGSLFAAILVFSGSQMIYLLSILFALVDLWRSQPEMGNEPIAEETNLRSRMFEYGTSMAIASLFSMVTWNFIEVFFLDYFWSDKSGYAAELAYYTLAISLAMFPVRLSRMSSETLLPAFSELYGGRELDRLSRGYETATVLSTVIGIFPCVMAWVLAPSLLAVLFPLELLPTVIPFRLLLIPSFFLAISYPGGAALPAIEGHRFFLKWAVMAALVNLVLDVWLIPKWGAVGAAAVNMLLQTAGSIASILYVGIYRKIGFPLMRVARSCGAAIMVGFLASGVSLLVRRLNGSNFFCLILGILGGTLLYIYFLRQWQIFGNNERQFFIRCQRFVPTRWQPRFLVLVAWISALSENIEPLEK